MVFIVSVNKIYIFPGDNFYKQIHLETPSGINKLTKQRIQIQLKIQNLKNKNPIEQLVMNASYIKCI